MLIHNPTSINDISVLMEDDVKERAETVTITITVKNEELAIQDVVNSLLFFRNPLNYLNVLRGFTKRY